LLNTLVKSSKPLGVTELKRTARLGVEKKELNRLLYGLEERGLVQRTVENPPLWSATTASTIILENNNDDDGSDEKAEGTIITSEEQKLIGFLMEQGEEQQRGMRVGSIAKFLGKSVAASNNEILPSSGDQNPIHPCGRLLKPVRRIMTQWCTRVSLRHRTTPFLHPHRILEKNTMGFSLKKIRHQNKRCSGHFNVPRNLKMPAVDHVLLGQTLQPKKQQLHTR